MKILLKTRNNVECINLLVAEQISIPGFWEVEISLLRIQYNACDIICVLEE